MESRGVSEIIGFLIITAALFGVVSYVLVAESQHAETKAQGLIDVMREAEQRQGELLTYVHASGSVENAANSWLQGWGCRREATIIGSTAGAQADYEMEVVVHKGGGTDNATDLFLGADVRDDFGDVRWTASDGRTQLLYFMQSYVPGSAAIFWVRIGSIPASPSTTNVFVYHGNSGATTTSSAAAVEFWDDCSSLSKWAVVSGSWTIDAGAIKGVSTGGMGLLKLNDPPSLASKKINLDIKWTETSNTTAGVWPKVLDTSSNYIRTVLSTEADGTGVKNQAVVGGAGYTHVFGWGHSADTWYHQEIDLDGPYVRDAMNGFSYSFSDSNFDQTWTWVYLGVYANSGPNLWVDNFLITKFVNPEPTWGSFGSEVSAPNPLTVSLYNYGTENVVLSRAFVNGVGVQVLGYSDAATGAAYGSIPPGALVNVTFSGSPPSSQFYLTVLSANKSLYSWRVVL